MTAHIDYYFTCISPFSYFGHQAIGAVARRHGAVLDLRPFRLGTVFQTSGAVPLAQRPVPRQRYRMLELQRIAAMRNLPVNLKPAHFPTDPALADATVAALVEDGADAFAYLDSLYRAVWVDELNVADDAVLADRLEKAGFDAAAIIARARGEAVNALVDANTEAAIAAGALGSPTYVLNGEVFWGQDRVEHVDHALATRRGPFFADMA
ncbi:MAG: disulfide bond formation protein DsbA [Phyllobacteriaceae bacterium]|nr:disulfide bond formation protein DsbA [Phyllobacteriaceae bacterium]MBA91594.1 disulfide bond formation protein DsbA [Phyllobacteriaceae bacterium]